MKRLLCLLHHADIMAQFIIGSSISGEWLSAEWALQPTSQTFHPQHL